MATGASRGVVPQAVGRQGGEQRHHLGRAHHGAAAERHDELRAVLARKGGALLDHLLGGVGRDLVEQHRVHPGQPQLLERPVQVAVGAHGLAVGYHEHGPLARHGLLVQVAKLAGAKEQAGWCMEAEAVRGRCRVLPHACARRRHRNAGSRAARRGHTSHFTMCDGMRRSLNWANTSRPRIAERVLRCGDSSARVCAPWNRCAAGPARHPGAAAAS